MAYLTAPVKQGWRLADQHHTQSRHGNARHTEGPKGLFQHWPRDDSSDSCKEGEILAYTTIQDVRLTSKMRTSSRKGKRKLRQ